MNSVIKVLKKTLMENVILVIITIVFFSYLLISGDEDAGRIFVFLILFPIWLGFAYSLLSIFFDWKLWQALRKQFLIYLILGGSISSIFYIFFKDEVYVYASGGLGLGLVLFVVEKLFSIGSRK